jgi:hypothetical protein
MMAKGVPTPWDFDRPYNEVVNMDERMTGFALMLAAVVFFAAHFGLTAGGADDNEKELLSRLMRGQRVMACFIAVVVALLAAASLLGTTVSPQ